MILIVTSRADLTADFLISELRRQGKAYFRFNTEDFPTRYQIHWSPEGSTTLTCHGKPALCLADVRSVWFRRPSLPRAPAGITSVSAQRYCEFESAAVLANLWRCFEQPLWVSHPDHIARASHKLLQLQAALRLGFHIPQTLVTNNRDVLLQFHDQLGGNVVGKVIHQQRPDENDPFIILTNRLARHEIAQDVSATPLMVQAYVEKGRELRVTVVGTQVFAVALYSQAVPEASIDWRRATLDVPHEIVELPVGLRNKLLAMINYFELRFGAFDLVETPDGEFYFLELNPNGQWAWLQQLTGVPIREALIDLLSLGPNSLGLG